jgi:hypothetical protein
MKIRNLKTRVIGPVLVLSPMACMHMGDGHHSGDRQCLDSQPSYQTSIYVRAVAGVMGPEGVTIYPDAEKGRGETAETLENHNNLQ